MDKGFIVGCDKAREWMLPWWWEKYHHIHTLPVAFADFGMSLDAKLWCKDRGHIIEIENKEGALQKQQMSTVYHMSDKLEALLKTPFETTIWLDLDCEVVKSLEPLFSKLHPKTFFAVAPDASYKLEGRRYNSGVIVYKKSSWVLSQWKQLLQHPLYHSSCEDKLLTDLLQQEGIEFNELSPIYNWPIQNHIHPEAAILHWQGPWGKKIIWNEIKKGLYHLLKRCKIPAF